MPVEWVKKCRVDRDVDDADAVVLAAHLRSELHLVAQIVAGVVAAG